MRVARILYPIQALGPGNRVVVWTAGCKKGCSKCENPELWDSSPGQEVETGKLAERLVEMSNVYGAHEITITGGDPLEQPMDLLEVLRLIRSSYDDVLLYTGYEWQEIELGFGPLFLSNLCKLVDVIVDGRYVDEKNDKGLALRGSSNQTIRFLSDGLAEKYEPYIAQGRIVQNIAYGGRVISVGIHNLGTFEEDVNE